VPLFYNQSLRAAIELAWKLRQCGTGALYPFGHGLSYTTFEYTDLRIAAAQAEPGGVVDVSVTVRNSGATKAMKWCSCMSAMKPAACRAR